MQYSLEYCLPNVFWKWVVLTFYKDCISLPVTPKVLHRIKKPEQAWMPFKRGGKTRCFRNASCEVLPWTTWNLQALLFAWTETYSGLWSQSINSQRGTDWNTETLSEGWNFEWNTWSKGEISCFLIAEDASVSILSRNILCLKAREFWSWFERSKMSWIPLGFCPV